MPMSVGPEMFPGCGPWIGPWLSWMGRVLFADTGDAGEVLLHCTFAVAQVVVVLIAQRPVVRVDFRVDVEAAAILGALGSC